MRVSIVTSTPPPSHTVYYYPTIRRHGRNITDAAIVAVANNCPDLASLTVGYVV